MLQRLYAEQLLSILDFDDNAGDVVALRFTLLDPSDHKRVFEVHIDASDSEFTLPFCKPQLPPSVLKPILTTLSVGGQLNTFIKDIRRAFVVFVENEQGGKHALH